MRLTIYDMENKKFIWDFRGRRSVRLKGYSYSLPGIYYVTICTVGRRCLFGDIHDGAMNLNLFGEIVKDVWRYLSNHFTNVVQGIYIIMPNHVHAIIQIKDNPHSTVGARSPRPEEKCPFPRLDGHISPRPDQQLQPLNNSYQSKNRRGGETPPLQHIEHPTLGQIIAYWKYESSKRINEIRKNARLASLAA